MSQSNTNGKWFVHCDCRTREIVIAELPTGRPGTVQEEVAVPSGSYYIRDICFVENCKDHVLLCCSHFMDRDVLHESGQLVLVDLAQTRLRKKLAVLSVTVCPDFAESGANAFMPVEPSFVDCPLIEEGTSCVHNIVPRISILGQAHGAVSQLNSSQFCVFGWSSYEVWDVNDLSNTVRTCECLCGCTMEQAFIEGGLLFQMSYSMKEIHVTDEYSGAHITTLSLFTPLKNILGHFSLLLQ
ncbi:hypothetical protein Pelo_8800 [Pelomyxa schiedti]|nr:hypothetical protein Pelo_8800 [Pelomyxa schiedti]